jgi:hypothetical protein
VTVLKACDGRSAIEATVEPPTSKRVCGVWKSLDERWADWTT